MSSTFYGEGVYGAGLYGSGELVLTAITLDGVPVDLNTVLADVTIRHGRAGFFDSASPSTCQLTLIGLPSSVTRSFRLGTLVVIYAAGDGAGELPRFTGRATDGDLDGGALTAIAVGRLRTLSGYTVGTVAYPEEAWSARVARAFAEAGLAAVLELQVGAFDPLLLARPADPVELSSYLDELVETVESAVADRPDGRILVQAIGSRTSAGAVELDPALVAYAPAWEIRLPAGNIVTVSYGSPEASVVSQDAASVALYGPIPATISSDLKLIADATTAANLRLARTAYSHWTIPAGTVLAGKRLELGRLAGLSLLPPPAPYPYWSPVLEGWTDHVVSDGEELEWTMELALSDPLLSGLALPWQDVPTAEKWSTTTPTLEWRDALAVSDF